MLFIIVVIHNAEANLDTEDLNAEMAEKDDEGDTTIPEKKDTSSHLLGTGSVSFSIDCSFRSLLHFCLFVSIGCKLLHHYAVS